MARQVVGNPFENQIGSVSATATPVDIYERGVVKRSPFEALANTLSNLEQKASPILERERQRLAQKEFAEGEALYNKTRTSIGQAVKDGIIDEGASPYLRKGYRVSNLNILSSKFATELNLELSRKQLYKNGNPEAAANFAAKFAEDFKKREGFDQFGATEVSNYFLPTEQKTRAAFQSAWQTKHLEWQKQQNYLRFEQEIATFTNDLFSPTDDFQTKQAKTIQLQEWISGRMAEADRDGMDRQQVNNSILNAVMVTAQEQLDTGILNLLDNLKTGTGTLGSSVSVRGKVMTLTNQINNTIASNEAAIGKTIKAEQDAAIDSAKSDLFGAAMAYYSGEGANPETQSIMVNAISTLRANGDADAARTWFKFSQEMEKAGIEDRNEDEIANAELFSYLSEVPTRTDAIKAINTSLANGSITFGTGLTALINVERRFKDRETAPKRDYMISGNLVNESFSRFEAVISARDAFGNTVNNDIVNNAISLAHKEYDLWLSQQADTPTDLQRREAADAIVARLRPIFVSQDVDDTTGQTLEDIAASRNPPEQPQPQPQPPENNQGLIDRLFNWWRTEEGGVVP